MELIQTINCGNDFSLLDSQLLKIMDSNISGIRLNLNKYNQNSEVDSLSRLIEIISKYKQRYKFLYDLPFPYNKTRILEYKITGDVIKKGKIYTVYFNRNDFIKAQENAVLLSKPKNSYNNSEVIYYGDGQGAFDVVKESRDKVVLKALCDFHIYNRKGITYGKGKINDKIEPVLKKIGDICSPLDYGCALSLVEDDQDISSFINLIGKKLQLVSKIETNESITNLEKIVEKSDGIMLARGDLALLAQHERLRLPVRAARHAAHLDRGRPRQRFAAVAARRQLLDRADRQDRLGPQERPHLCARGRHAAPARRHQQERAGGRAQADRFDRLQQRLDQGEAVLHDRPADGDRGGRRRHHAARPARDRLVLRGREPREGQAPGRHGQRGGVCAEALHAVPVVRPGHDRDAREKAETAEILGDLAQADRQLPRRGDELPRGCVCARRPEAQRGPARGAPPRPALRRLGGLLRLRRMDADLRRPRNRPGILRQPAAQL